MAKATFLPADRTIHLDETTTLREAAHLLGVNVHDRCGGLGACCNCVVTIIAGMDNICPKTDVEAAVFYWQKTIDFLASVELPGT